jgi:hypothetical protein
MVCLRVDRWRLISQRRGPKMRVLRLARITTVFVVLVVAIAGLRRG